ncbi:hypothetical protein IAT40_005707 [Kwoniella sp. CBS 6097]
MDSLIHRLPKLPPKSERNAGHSNPFKIFGKLTPLMWAFFFSGWFAWVCDAIDFFAMSLSTARLATYFRRPVSEVTLSITLTLLFRPLGALIFGLAGDRYGRKWPLVINMVVLSLLSLGTGFVKNWSAFLALRSLFGCAMGGVWGLAVSQSLENMPVEARGIFSGFLQLGYPVGYLIIAAINLEKKVAQAGNWRYLFWIGAGFAMASAIIRLVVPESTYFTERKKLQRQHQQQQQNPQAGSQGHQEWVFAKELFRMLKKDWALCVFGIVFMTAFNFYSHGSQDLYPTYIQKGKGLSQMDATRTTIIGNVGAIAGCTVGGYVSQYLGRRITIIVMCLFCCAMLPLWLLPNTFGGLAAGAFFVQAGVQGAYGVVPVYLSEISPPAFRAMWPGVAYQLGNMISSAAAQIEATAGEKLKTHNGLPDYGKVSAILIAVAAGVLILCCLIGMEDHGAKFEEGQAAFEVGAGDQRNARTHDAEPHDEEDGLEKPGVQHVEHATSRA